MAKQVSNGDNHSAAKPPPTPSPLRFSKFFQVLFDVIPIGPIHPLKTLRLQSLVLICFCLIHAMQSLARLSFH